MDSKDAIKFAQELMDEFLVSTKYIRTEAMKGDIVDILEEYGHHLIVREYKEVFSKLGSILFSTGDYGGKLCDYLYVGLEKKFLPSCSECKCTLIGEYATCSKCKATCCIKSCSVKLQRQSPRRSNKCQLQIPGKDNTEDSITCCSKCYGKVLDLILL